jgi:hypothetical protein
LLSKGKINVMVKASGVQAIKQDLFAKGLAQESDCPCGKHLRTRRLIGISRNEDRWRRETIDAEALIELHAAQTWHMHISDKTGRVINVI